MSKKDLKLIGTVPRDLDGSRRLEGLLNLLSPEVIALVHPKNIDYSKIFQEIERKKKGIRKYNSRIERTLTKDQRNLLRRAEATLIEAELYEMRSCMGYNRSHPSSILRCIDPLDLKSKVNTNTLILGLEEINPSELERDMDLVRKEIMKCRLEKDLAYFLGELRSDPGVLYRNPEMIRTLLGPHPFPTKEEFNDPVIAKRYASTKELQETREIYSPYRFEGMEREVRKLYDSGKKRLAVVVGVTLISKVESMIQDLNPSIITLEDFDRLSKSQKPSHELN